MRTDKLKRYPCFSALIRVQKCCPKLEVKVYLPIPAICRSRVITPKPRVSALAG
jgi:hypothetical protein